MCVPNIATLRPEWRYGNMISRFSSHIYLSIPMIKESIHHSTRSLATGRTPYHSGFYIKVHAPTLSIVYKASTPRNMLTMYSVDDNHKQCFEPYFEGTASC